MADMDRESGTDKREPAGLGHYTTVEGCAQAEIIEKKSRFIASVAHVETEDEAIAFIDTVKADHRMARHYVYAYVLREGGRVRYSDDGEPQKTAGLPTLDVVRHAGLTDVIIVTTRYFGGVLLGTGGLVRAYTAAAQAGIENAKLAVVSRCIDVRVALPYSLFEQASRSADACGAKIVQSEFSEEVHLAFRLLAGTEHPLVEKLSELSRGSASIEVSELFDAAF